VKPVAENDFRIVHDNILGGHRVTTGRQVPFCMFADPEFARIGLSEAEAPKRVAFRTDWRKSRWPRYCGPGRFPSPGAL
jgi:pyruvate/2-oxoglutarate dehydrogenase complex dihydrolipoamide dehydrogenase (E3) component